MRSATQLYCNTVVSHCACDFFPKILETMKRILPGSSSPSRLEGPGIEVDRYVTHTNVSFFDPSPDDQRTEHSCA